LETAKQLNITIISIPPGLTSTAQPADVSWNKPFKGFLRRKGTKKLMEDMMAMDDFCGNSGFSNPDLSLSLRMPQCLIKKSKFFNF